MKISFRLIPSAGSAFLAVACAHGVITPPSSSSFPELIPRIMKADYDGDRPGLDRLYGDVDVYLRDERVESRVRYWKGYTKWRRAMNGANEATTPPDLADDSALCADEMQRSSTLDPTFVDARVGEMACLGLVLFFDSRHAGNKERIDRLRVLLGDLKETASGNPRYVWAGGWPTSVHR